MISNFVNKSLSLLLIREREERPRREGDNFENRRGGRALGNKPGGGRGGPRRNFEDRRGKREFDRQSGSDKT